MNALPVTSKGSRRLPEASEVLAQIRQDETALWSDSEVSESFLKETERIYQPMRISSDTR